MSSRRSRGSWSVDPGWRSGRSPATPERLRTRQSTPHRPTLQHRTRIASHFVVPRTFNARDLQGFPGLGGLLPSLHGPLHRAICTRVAFRRPIRRRSWGGVGGIRPAASFSPPASAGISAAATSSRTAGTSRSATTSWIFGAARAASSLRWAARQRRAPRRPGRPALAPSGAPWRSARRSAATSCATPVAGQRASRPSSVVLRGSPRVARAAARCSSAASDARMAAPDLGQRPSRRQPGGDRDPQQVEHVGQLGLDRAAGAGGAWRRSASSGAR